MKRPEFVNSLLSLGGYMDEWNLKKDKEGIWAGWGCKSPYHRFSDNLHLIEASQHGQPLRDCICQKREIILRGCKSRY